MTTSDYLTQLQQDREDLVDNLETKGITGLTGDETFTELVPEVLNISGGGGADLSEYFNDTIASGTTSNPQTSGWYNSIKSYPVVSISGTSAMAMFAYYPGETIKLLDTSNVTNMGQMFYNCTNLTTVPLLDTSNVTNMQSMFNGCTNLLEIPLLNISNVTGIGLQQMFYNCTNLTTVPLLNATKAANFNNMFSGCSSLSTNSLDNILQMCINASSYTGVKTLAKIGLTSTYYPASTIQALPHYNDFINAGWTIGW